jgi:hypothetical protein
MHCTFVWTSTVFGNAPANSYRSGCHDDIAHGPYIISTGTYKQVLFDSIDVYYENTLYFTIKGLYNFTIDFQRGGIDKKQSKSDYEDAIMYLTGGEGF